MPAAAELDRAALGGLWTIDGYRQELERSSSDLLGMWTPLETRPLDNNLQDISCSCTLPQGVALPYSQVLLMGVGCGWTILDETHLVLLAVQPKFRRQGLGYAILIGLLACARDRGSNYATLEVRASNHVAITLYKKFGFKTAGRRPQYYSNADGKTSEDALILWRSGLQRAEFKTQLMQCWQSLAQRWAAQDWKIASPFENILK